MRLIDADALIDRLREIKTLYGVPMAERDEQMLHWVIGHIKEEPTAYDVERVVDELEKEIEKIENAVWTDYEERVIEASAFYGAIDKIRNGGKE